MTETKFEALAHHVEALGGLRGDREHERRPFTAEELARLTKLVDAPIAPALRWWWTTYGGRVSFAEPVVYPEPNTTGEVVVAWFLGADEIVKTIDAYRGALHPHRLPIMDDEGGNLLVVDHDGSVWEHTHDAPLDDNTYRVAPSFEAWVLSLKRGA